MTFQISKENYEKSYLDSMYVISHSQNTVKSYRTRIRLFRGFLKENYNIDEYDLLDHLKTGGLDIFKILKEFVIFLDKSGKSARTIHLALSVNRGYLRHMGIKIDSDDLKQLVKVPKVVKIREIPLDKEIIVRLLRNAKPKLQLAILVAVSTGMRIGEIVNLKISDIDFSQNPVKVYLRANTTKTRQSRETFLTAEAANALKDYLKRYHKWSEGTRDPQIQDKQIFATVYRHRGPFVAESIIATLQTELRYLVRAIPDLNVKDENGRQSIHLHSFRKYFRTTVGNVVGRDFAEAIIGHGFYMDTYYQLSDEKKREMYLEVEPYLTISDFQKVESNIKQMNEKYQDLENKMTSLMNYLRLNKIEVPQNPI
ncbi:site-specific integrase [Nitrosopumilus sp.]|uniref:tyrosine-type recombinase/integrase n=1 Tax=Nitrosopumilus sp. TaxID=2024843 RepID=UPI00247EA7C9|nr:site-specific integrase [Nitrosopumilus sp.]MCV0410771.1 site-specific integrase [Nitrosopumilus sp.]